MMKNKYQSTMPENAVTAADKQERINEDTIIVFSVCILSSRHKRDHELSEWPSCPLKFNEKQDAQLFLKS